jgi:hypothetical protein
VSEGHHLLPEPPQGSRPPELPPELAARTKRLRWTLLFFPFSFPRWFQLRREHPEAASTLRFEVALNLLQSTVFVVLLLVALGLLVFRQAIVDFLVRIIVGSTPGR